MFDQTTTNLLKNIALSLIDRGAEAELVMEGDRAKLFVRIAELHGLIVFRGQENKYFSKRIVGTVFVEAHEGINLPYAPMPPKFNVSLPAKPGVVASNILRRMPKVDQYRQEVEAMLLAAQSRRIRKNGAAALVTSIAHTNGALPHEGSDRNSDPVVYTGGVRLLFQDDLIELSATLPYDQLEDVAGMVDALTGKGVA